MSTSWVPADSREALRFVWSFDPTNGDPNDLATALGVAGVSPGLELPVLVEEGTAAVGSVVFEKLSERSSWGVPILLQMRDYGMPSGSMESPRPWPDTTLASIDAALATAADASYGACAQLIVDLNRTYIADEIERCASGECNWGRVWYAVPEAVTRPIGRLVDGDRFEGVITITSDTGAGDLLAITAERFDRWVITSRAPAGLPDAAAPNDCTSRE